MVNVVADCSLPKLLSCNEVVPIAFDFPPHTKSPD